jgi:site-specific recombinase XerD
MIRALPEAPVSIRRDDVSHAEAEWAEIALSSPELAGTFRRYLTQISTFLSPNSVIAADLSFRTLTWFLDERGSDVHSVAGLDRNLMEDFAVWLSERPGLKGPLSVSSRRQRLGMLHMFFERIIDWDWPGAPARNPVFIGDLPGRPDSMPKALDDEDAAKLMARAQAEPDPRRRLVVEVLGRTGMRAGELCDLAPDAVVHLEGKPWLRIPVGKLRNDRMIPLHPEVAALLETWSVVNAEHIARHQRLVADHRGRLDRHMVLRIVKRMGRDAGIGHVHPHQLRHTLATQAINRGMRLEAIAAMLGHRNMEMTLVYARIANRVVAEEYEAVSARVDAQYAQPSSLPAYSETPDMTRLRQEADSRMLGNGLCTRPVELDCRMETVCESCAYFKTGPEFVPVLIRQRDHARTHNQEDRAELFNGLLKQVIQETT